MSKKSVKSNPQAVAVKTTPKPQPAPVVNERVQEHNFSHSCAKQNFVLVWLDEDLNPNDPRCGILTTELKKIINKLDVFNDTNNCVKFMNGVQDQNIYLIVSNPTEPILDKVNRVAQVTDIFIDDEKKVSKDLWKNKWTKIRGFYTKIDDLCRSLKTVAKASDSDYQEFFIVSSDELGRRKINELDRAFMYTQLIKEIIIEMDYDGNSPQQLVTYCNQNRSQFTVDDWSALDTFKREYLKTDKTPIYWYTLNNFLYKVVNQALYRQRFNQIIEMAFFIKDVYQQLVDLHKKQNWEKRSVPPLFRGQGMSLNQLEDLKRNPGGLVAFNSFMSTSRKVTVAKHFIDMALDENSPSQCAVLFEITVEDAFKNAVFADIVDFSHYGKNEEETLFALGTIFKIGDARHTGYGTRGRPIWNVKLTLCANTDRDLHVLMQHIREQLKGPTPLYRLGVFLLKVAQYEAAFEIFQRALTFARTDQDRANINFQIGFALYNQRDPEALRWYEEALAIYQRNIGEIDPNTASIYNNIGLFYSQQNDHKRSLDYFHKAREIYEKSKPDDLITAASYNNIASEYDQLDDFQKAIEFYEKSLEIHRKQRIPNNPDRATLENNLGILHKKRKQNKEAAERFKNAVAIGEKALPADHPDLTIYKQHLQTMQYEQQKYK